MNDSSEHRSDWKWLWRRPLWSLVRARLKEFFREPAAIFWVYCFPLLMMASLGLAFRNRPVEQVRVAVVQEDGAASIVEALQEDPRFVARVLSEQESRRRLRVGKAELVVRLLPSDPPTYEYLYDPTNPAGLLARNTVDEQLQTAAGREDAVRTQDIEWKEPGGRYVDFLVPGLLGLGLMGGGLFGVGFAIVDLRIRKLLKRFLATPLKRSDFLLAMVISRLLFTFSEALMLLLMGRFLFGVVIQGELLLVVLLIVLGALEFSGIGLLVASRAQTLETVSGLMNLVMLPMWVTSGVFFSYERFPAALHPFIQVLPLTALIDALRAVIQEGASLTSLAWPVGIMAAWGIGSFWLALRWFRWS